MKLSSLKDFIKFSFSPLKNFNVTFLFLLKKSLLQSKMLVFHFFFRKNGTNKDPLEVCSFLLVSPTMSSNQFNITFFQLTKKLHVVKVCGNSGTQDKESIKFPQSTL